MRTGTPKPSRSQDSITRSQEITLDRSNRKKPGLPAGLALQPPGQTGPGWVTSIPGGQHKWYRIEHIV